MSLARRFFQLMHTNVLWLGLNLISRYVLGCAYKACELIHDDRLYSDGGCCGTVTFADLRTVKQAIQLLTLMWTSGTSPRSVPQSAQRFLAALVNWLGDLKSDSEAWRVLGDAFIGIVAILEQRRADPTFAAIDRCWDELAVWRLAREADPNELPLACE